MKDQNTDTRQDKVAGLSYAPMESNGKLSPPPANGHAMDTFQLKENSPEVAESITSETKIDLGTGESEGVVSDNSSGRTGSEYRILKRVPKESSPTTDL